MTLLQRVCLELERMGIEHALIGAFALAAHGVLRTSVDLDLFTTESAVLDAKRWETLTGGDVAVRVRKGDAEDPLAGVVTFDSAGERPVDLVVGKWPWQRRAVERAEPASAGMPRVVRLVDLVLLKLYAGGPQDAWDVEQLVATAAGSRAVEEIERELAVLPAEAVALWRRLHPSA